MGRGSGILRIALGKTPPNSDAYGRGIARRSGHRLPPHGWHQPDFQEGAQGSEGAGKDERPIRRRMTKHKLQITVKQPPADGDQPGYDLFALWKEYEGIAMHFNDLLLKIRTQSLAAVAAFATIAGVLLKGDDVSQAIRWGTLTMVF